MGAFPFEYLLSVQADVPSGFEFWLRHSTVRNTRALLETCPRIDWLVWAVGKAIVAGELPQTVFAEVQARAEPYLAQLQAGRRSEAYPTHYGLSRLRPLLVDAYIRTFPDPLCT